MVRVEEFRRVYRLLGFRASEASERFGEIPKAPEEDFGLTATLKKLLKASTHAPLALKPFGVHGFGGRGFKV